MNTQHGLLIWQSFECLCVCALRVQKPTISNSSSRYRIFGYLPDKLGFSFSVEEDCEFLLVDIICSMDGWMFLCVYRIPFAFIECC